MLSGCNVISAHCQHITCSEVIHYSVRAHALVSRPPGLMIVPQDTPQAKVSLPPPPETCVRLVEKMFKCAANSRAHLQHGIKFIVSLVYNGFEGLPGLLVTVAVARRQGGLGAIP